MLKTFSFFLFSLQEDYGGNNITHFSWQVSNLSGRECIFYFSGNVFSMSVLHVLGDTIFMSPTGDGTAILHCHPNHANVYLLAVQRKYLHFSVILRP